LLGVVAYRRRAARHQAEGPTRWPLAALCKSVDECAGDSAEGSENLTTSSNRRHGMSLLRQKRCVNQVMHRRGHTGVFSHAGHGTSERFELRSLSLSEVALHGRGAGWRQSVYIAKGLFNRTRVKRHSTR